MITRNWALVPSMLLPIVLFTACSGVSPTIAPAPTQPADISASASQFETQSNSGGSVAVDVTPKVVQVGQAMAFAIRMNTHSVDLGDDMTQIAILRDDTGKEYAPTAWEGQVPGGHHRSGVLKFAALTSKPRYVELIIRGLAKVTERVFRWDMF